MSFQVAAGSPARCRDIRTPFFVSHKNRSNTCGRFGSPSGGTLNSLTRHFCFFCNVLMWHSAVIAELRQLMIVARPQTRPPPLSLSLCAVPRSRAGILMNTWRWSSADRQAPGCGAGVVLVVVLGEGWAGQRPRVTPKLSNKSCSFTVLTPWPLLPVRHSV